MEYYNLDENNVYIVSFDLVDENGDKVSKSIIGTMLLTQYYYNSELKSSDKYHLNIINGRDNQDVLDKNNVTVTEYSDRTEVKWEMQPEDTAKLSDKEIEMHIALFVWQWSGKQNSYEFYFYVRDIPHIT